MRRLKLIAATLLLAILSPHCVRATDIPIFPTGPVFTLTGLTWGVSGPGGFNNNFFLTPLSNNESVCVLVYNGNTTSAHPFSIAIAVNGNPSNKTPSDGTWQNLSFSSFVLAPASPGIAGGIGTPVSGTANVSINLSASTTLAGAPETATVIISQTQGTCLSGANVIGGSIYTTTSAQPISSVSESLGQAFYAQSGNVLNPTIGQVVLHVNSGNGSRSLYFYKTSVVCTATCNISFNTTSNLGGTCTAASSLTMRLTSGVSSTTTTNQAPCVSAPAATTFYTINLAANTPYDLDLSGIIAPANVNSGFDITMSTALTGTVNASIRWYEK